MHQSTTPSLSQTIWPRWASREFLSLPIVETLLPVTFGYFLSLEAVVMRRRLLWALPEVVGTVQKCIAAGGDCFEGDLCIIRVLSIKMPIRKKYGNLSYAPPTFTWNCLLIMIISGKSHHDIVTNVLNCTLLD